MSPHISFARRSLAALVVLALAAGCSGSGRDDTASPTSTTAGADGFAPVTVSHRYGETEISAPPQRIVSLDWQWTDVLLALDAAPAGYLVDPNLTEELPWRDGLIDDSTRLEATTTIPDEQIRKLEPDLIVVTYLAEDQDDFDALSKIAPTIALLGDGEVDTWQDIATTAGDILGRSDDATALIDGVEADVAAVAAEHPALAGGTYSFANYLPGDAMYVLSDPTDGAGILFSQLGMEIAPAILDADDASPGRVKLSLEVVDLLDADLVVVLTNGTDLADIPGLTDLAAFEGGAFVEMDWVLATALNTPSPLSIPYALEALEPALAAVG